MLGHRYHQTSHPSIHPFVWKVQEAVVTLQLSLVPDMQLLPDEGVLVRHESVHNGKSIQG